MSIAVLGTGNIGAEVARILRKMGIEVETFDADRMKQATTIDLSDRKNVDAICKRKWDVIVNALPSAIGYQALGRIVANGQNCVDVTFMPEDPMEEISEEAEHSGSTVVVDFGLAPGITNMLVGLVKEPKDIKICVGGNPIHPEPPLYYNAQFAPNDVIEEYTRPARIVRPLHGHVGGRGIRVTVDPLTERELIFFEGVGLQEAFLTDGLRTLLSFNDLDSAVEKTLRWPGHIDKIKLLQEMNMLNADMLYKGYQDDVVTMRVEVNDECWTMVAFGENGKSAMARTTASPVAYMAARLTSSGLEPKMYAPEDLPPTVINNIIDDLQKEGIEIKNG